MLTHVSTGTLFEPEDITYGYGYPEDTEVTYFWGFFVSDTVVAISCRVDVHEGKGPQEISFHNLEDDTHGTVNV